MVGTFENPSFGQQSIKLDSGDTLIFYTDGVTDAQDLNEEFYEQDRLEKVLKGQQFSSSGHIIDSITNKDFMGEQNQFDDITIVTLHFS